MMIPDGQQTHTVYNVANLVESVRKRAKDTTFDRDLIVEYLDEVSERVLGRSRFTFMQESDTDVVGSGDTELVLDNEIEVLYSFKLIDADGNVFRPVYVPYAEFFERFDTDEASASSPSFYSWFGDTIIFATPLDRSYDVALKYLKTRQTLSSDTDVPDIPEKKREILIRGGLQGVEEYRGNHDIAALHEKKVEELAEDLLGRSSGRNMTQPHKARFGRR